MSDYFGTRQTRVLSVADRSLDNVIFQYRTPALTSEWNLINQIGNEKAQNVARLSCPSGWLNVGEILQDWTEADIQTGQVNCSASYTANTFKLFSKNGCRAIVNGWPLLIQGSNSSDDNNVIQLDPPEDQVYDFVFLEAWRKLIAADDAVYPYGNVQVSPYSDNEVEWDVMGTETTKRVQIQYRIRSVVITSPLDAMSDVFSDEDIHPIGGRITGESSFDTFRKYGASDAGLYISGDGTSTSETTLNTVDGYVYAIPMFLVYRRVESDDIFTATNMKRTFVNRQDSIVGYRSDRPDGSLSDVIYKDDIVDFRHKILTSGKELDVTLQQSVSKLVAGELTTALKRGFSDTGGDTTASSGGSTLMKVERINGGVDGIPNVGTGSGITEYDFKRRAFCNAEIEHDHNVIRVPINGGSIWAAGTISVSSVLATAPAGTVISVDGFYMPDETNPIPTGVSATTATITIADTGANSIVGTAKKLIMEFTYKYSSSTNGFKDVPKELLEAGKGTFLPIATRDNDVPLRFNSAIPPELLNFGASVSQPGYPGEIDSRDFLRYRGGNYTEKSNFGHEMVVHRITNGSGSVTLTLTDGKYNGYYILGVKSVALETVLDDPVSFTMQRAVSTTPSYAITSYTITAASCLSAAVQIVLYVGSKPPISIGDYSIAESLKFYEISKQGRGVIDTYEVIELVSEVEVGSGVYWIDSGDKPIIAFLTMAEKSGGYVEGTPYAWRYNSTNYSVSITAPNNQNLPVLVSSEYSPDLMPTRIKITAAAGLVRIRVPVLVHSYVAQSETPYNFYYKTNAYQGLLTDETIYGKMVDEGPALITTLGSGNITNYEYNTGTASVSAYSRNVVGSSTTQWDTHAQVGDYIRFSTDTLYYRIFEITNYNNLIIAEVYAGSSQSNVSYEVIRLDVPTTNISNVIDRMPSLKNLSGASDGVADYTCYSDGVLLQMVQAQLRSQDPLLALPNDFKLGNTTAERGRNDLQLTMGLNSIYKLSSTPHAHVLYESTTALSTGHYKKVYQVYLFNRSDKGGTSPDLTGRMYMMVISGEKKSSTENMLDGMMNIDTVDLFEMVGRPLIKFD